MPKARNIINISVNAQAKAIISRIAEKHEMKEIGVASRIYEWFAAQDDIVQKGVLRLLPEGFEREVIKLALERLAKEGGTQQSSPSRK